MIMNIPLATCLMLHIESVSSKIEIDTTGDGKAGGGACTFKYPHRLFSQIWFDTLYVEVYC